MELKIDEKIINEIIGVDLEPIDGDTPNSTNHETFVNKHNNRESSPPTSTTINRIASKEPSLLSRYLYGGNARSYVRENNVVHEDIINDKKPPANIISNDTVNFEDLSKLYNEEILQQNITKIINDINKMSQRKEDDEISNIRFIVISHVINELNAFDLNKKYKAILINAIK